MLSYFTNPYPDELLYSVFARYHFYSGNIDFRDTLEELFGKRSVIPIFLMGSNLSHLCEELGGAYTPEHLIQSHTVFPFYSPFMSEFHKSRIIDKAKSDGGPGILTEMGIVAGGVCRKDGVYYCAKCAEEDVKQYSEPYIHRIHQLEGVWVCPQHDCLLSKYKIAMKERCRLEYVRFEEKYIDFLLPSAIYTSVQMNHLKRVAKAAEFLMNCEDIALGKDKIHKWYESYLEGLGLFTEHRHVRQKELYRMLINFYGEETLNIFESEINPDNGYNWAQVVTRDEKRMVHPLRHILLMLLLAEDMEHFFDKDNGRKTLFGKGPWPCLNPVSGHYRQATITEFITLHEKKAREPIGAFSCVCGYSYSRKAGEENRYKKQRVLEFGELWKERLGEMLSDKKSYHHIALVLGCDIKTIHNFEKRHEQSGEFTKSGKNVDDVNGLSAKANEYVNTISKTIEVNKTATRTEIRNLCRKEYIFLYRHNRELLINILPAVKKERQRKEYVDWEKRDRELLDELDLAKMRILKRNWNTRVTKTFLAREIGHPDLCRKEILKLPLCEGFLKTNTETVEQFHKRLSEKHSIY